MRFNTFLKSLGFKSVSPYSWAMNGISISKTTKRGGGGYVVTVNGNKFTVSNLSDINHPSSKDLISYIRGISQNSHSSCERIDSSTDLNEIIDIIKKCQALNGKVELNFKENTMKIEF